MVCNQCGRMLEGDGINIVFHCPNADMNYVESLEPDANPVDCDGEENE